MFGQAIKRLGGTNGYATGFRSRMNGVSLDDGSFYVRADEHPKADDQNYDYDDQGLAPGLAALPALIKLGSVVILVIHLVFALELHLVVARRRYSADSLIGKNPAELERRA